MVDEDIRRLEREHGATSVPVLRARYRAGVARVCVFCTHPISGEALCGHRRQHNVGEHVFLPQEQRTPGSAMWVGTCVSRGTMVVNIPGQHIPIPEAWEPPACVCDHAEVPEQATLEAYERARGVDLLLIRNLGLGSVLYHTEARNRDGTPQRWRVNGQPKLWKTRPKEFMLPVKHGMYTYNRVTEINCHEFRTEEKWAK